MGGAALTRQPLVGHDLVLSPERKQHRKQAPTHTSSSNAATTTHPLYHDDDQRHARSTHQAIREQVTDETEDTVSDPDQPPVQPPAELNTSIAHPARVYDYWLGGKDNYPADRAAAQAVMAELPDIPLTAKENRAFLRRVVRFLAAEAGIRQFLDIGSGLPTQGNVHQVAQQVAPDARIVYIDNDPIVLVHGRALLAGSNTAVVQADLREPDAILDDPETRQLIDFDQPTAVLLSAILHHIRDEEDPAGIVARLRDAIGPGSYVAISHGTADFSPEAATRAAARFAQARTAAPYVHRSRAEIERFLDGLELVFPGLVQLPLWRPDGKIPDYVSRVTMYGGVGRKR
jgi:hypothetical protein